MHRTQTAESQADMTPAQALERLRLGNERFVSKTQVVRDLSQQIQQTSTGQYPFATVLGCIDSRVPIEVVFDQGIGDVFAARVAGNVVSDHMLGSFEFACKLAGSKLIVVLGHTSCGAVKGACDGVEMEHLSELLRKVRHAVDDVPEPVEPDQRTSANATFVDAVARRNVELAVKDIRTESTTLAELEQAGAIAVVGALYDVASGVVHFLDAD